MCLPSKVSKKHVGKEVAKQIHEKAAPFIEWLKNAEEESSDEGDDDIAVVYSNEPTGGLKVVTETNGKSEEDNKEEDGDNDDDINIDDI